MWALKENSLSTEVFRLLEMQNCGLHNVITKRRGPNGTLHETFGSPPPPQMPLNFELASRIDDILWLASRVDEVQRLASRVAGVQRLASRG
jgi:hypothetical protein